MGMSEEAKALLRDIHRLQERSAALAAEAEALVARARQLLALADEHRAVAEDGTRPVGLVSRPPCGSGG
jgi:hypothetical protein